MKDQDQDQKPIPSKPKNSTFKPSPPHSHPYPLKHSTLPLTTTTTTTNTNTHTSTTNKRKSLSIQKKPTRQSTPESRPTLNTEGDLDKKSQILINIASIARNSPPITHKHDLCVYADALILNTPLQLSNQFVIKADARRTRHDALLSSFQFDFVLYLETLLSFYARNSRIKYKQGMNEVQCLFFVIFLCVF
jgi:hypothetical protein